MKDNTINRSLSLGAIFIFLAIALGAFGTHGLKNILTEKLLTTFNTGVRYQLYHGFGLMLLAITSKVFSIKIKYSFWLFLSGIFLFSFNCYLYSLTQIKTFAMIVPLGGLCFLCGWAILIWSIYKIDRN